MQTVESTKAAHAVLGRFVFSERAHTSRRASMNLRMRQPFVLPQSTKIWLAARVEVGDCSPAGNHNVTSRVPDTLETTEDAAEEAEGAAAVGGVEVKSAQHEAEVVTICVLHGFGRVVCRKHHLLHQVGKDFEIG